MEEIFIGANKDIKQKLKKYKIIQKILVAKYCFIYYIKKIKIRLLYV